MKLKDAIKLCGGVANPRYHASHGEISFEKGILTATDGICTIRLSVDESDCILLGDGTGIAFDAKAALACTRAYPDLNFHLDGETIKCGPVHLSYRPTQAANGVYSPTWAASNHRPSLVDAINGECFSDTIAGVINTSGTDASMPWSNGVTLTKGDRNGVYNLFSTNDATMVMGELFPGHDNWQEHSVLLPRDALTYMLQICSVVEPEAVDLRWDNERLVFWANEYASLEVPLDFGNAMPKMFTDTYKKYECRGQMPKSECQDFLEVLHKHSQFEPSDSHSIFKVYGDEVQITTRGKGAHLESKVKIPNVKDPITFNASCRRLYRLFRFADYWIIHNDGTLQLIDTTACTYLLVAPLEQLDF